MDRHPQPPSQPFPGPSPAPSSASSSLPSYHRASTAQPPVHVPFSDPFHNRDPFLPSASSRSRRASYGVHSSGPAMPQPSTATAPGPGPGPGNATPYGDRAWSTQPPASLASAHHQRSSSSSQQLHQLHHQNPQAPAANPATTAAVAPAPPPAQMSNAGHVYDSVRRQSFGSERYAPLGAPLEPPPPPPPPPPAFAARNMPPPSPTSGGPASSFSMPAPRHTPSASPYVGSRDLPGFAQRPGATMSISSLIGTDSSRNGNHSPHTTATAPSPPLKPIHPPSPQNRARSSSTRAPNAQYQRPPSPAPMSQGSRSVEAKAHPYHPPAGHPPPPFSQPAHPGFRPVQSSPSSSHADEPHHYPGHPPTRPSSQPMYAQMEQEMRHRQELHDRQSSRHAPFPPYTDHMGRMLTPSQPPSSSRQEILERAEMNGHAHYPPPPPPPPPAMSQTARSTPAPLPQSFGRMSYGPGREDYPGSFRPAGHAQGREEVEQRGPHNEMLGRPEHRYSPTNVEADARQRPSAAHYAIYGPPGYEVRDGDEHPLQRAFLGVASDIGRKNGRSSPLPQAVQGAQPRHVRPGGDAGVKSEFGRMFSGLGSGVGSNTPTAGIATPSRLSPSRHADGSEDTEGRKNRSRLREDGGREESDGADGRSTPTLSQRESKRPKTAHPSAPPPHHHHHHAHAHHHHHHHHGMAEEQLAHGAAAFNTLRFQHNASVPQQAPNAAHHHHHHHHHPVHAHQAHHHHHNVRPPPTASHRKPQTTVSNQHLLSSVASLPRKHLGSQLYSTKISLPPRESTPLDSRHHFKSSAKPIPRFDEKDNCTFTVRVPSAYIYKTSEDAKAIAGGLEEICRTRAVWGTDVYSDDSDPVAACVHAGWIRGDFGDYNADLRELFLSQQGEGEGDETAEVGKLMTEKPKQPLELPQNADMHITILLLPALRHYTASTQHFLRSREWGSDHDGVSYMIHSVEFVTESMANRFTERTAAAKHQRIREDLARRREAAETLLGLLQSNGSEARNGTAMEKGGGVSVGA